jgi:hypothetical protein
MYTYTQSTLFSEYDGLGICIRYILGDLKIGETRHIFHTLSHNVCCHDKRVRVLPLSCFRVIRACVYPNMGIGKHDEISRIEGVIEFSQKQLVNHGE